MKLDIGCGPKKAPGFVGMDRHDYGDTDIIWNVEQYPWPLDENSCDELRSWHLVEHLKDLKPFLNEVHRVGKNGALFQFATPHFSSRDSWNDPTHIQHYSLHFTDIFTDGYLKGQWGNFELVDRRLSFGSFLYTWRSRLIFKVIGAKHWEKFFAWRHPASAIYVTLKVVK